MHCGTEKRVLSQRCSLSFLWRKTGRAWRADGGGHFHPGRLKCATKQPAGLPLAFHLLVGSFSDGRAGEQRILKPPTPRRPCGVVCCGRLWVMPESELPSKSFATTPRTAAARLDSIVANLWSMKCESVTRKALADHVQCPETLPH